MSATLTRLAALGATSFRQALRDKVLHVLVGFGGLMVVGSLIISELTVGERARIVMDLGMTATSLLANFVAVFVTVGQVAREIERRTIVVVATKPVARWEILVGRFAGMGATLALMVAVMTVLHALMLLAVEGYRATLWHAALLTFTESLLVCSIALFLSSFATPLPSMFLTLGFVVIGHTSWGLLMLADSVQSAAAKTCLRVLHALLPNLSLLDVRQPVTWGEPIGIDVVGLGVAYGLGYSMVLLILGAGLFSRRDLA